MATCHLTVSFSRGKSAVADAWGYESTWFVVTAGNPEFNDCVYNVSGSLEYEVQMSPTVEKLAVVKQRVCKKLMFMVASWSPERHENRMYRRTSAVRRRIVLSLFVGIRLHLDTALAIVVWLFSGSHSLMKT